MKPSRVRTIKRFANQGMRSSLTGIFANLGLAVTKCVADLWGHSFALVADGLESPADVVSGFVVYFGLKISVKPPDPDHPYGHGKLEPTATVVVGLSLMAAAVAIIVEGIHGIRTPHPLPKAYTLVVLAGVLIVKEMLFRHVGAVAKKIRGAQGVQRRAPDAALNHSESCKLLKSTAPSVLEQNITQVPRFAATEGKNEVTGCLQRRDTWSHRRAYYGEKVAPMTETILLVGSEPVDQQSAIQVLLKANYQVRYSSDSNAIGVLTTEMPSAVLLNLEPESAQELCFLIRRIAPAVPLFVIGRENNTAVKVGLFQAEADDYIRDPFDSTELIARIRSALRRSQKQGLRDS